MKPTILKSYRRDGDSELATSATPGPNFPWDKFQQLVTGDQAPLSTLITAIPKALNGSALDQFKTATLADEEANFKIRENLNIKSLHK